ncbi:MAG: virulence factor Mce family protein [Candidatus Accumulibacter sp. BA-94]|nr:MAG: virulence factor Mce family protein [Candidatus Accumulibacter sp. BA-94]MBL8248826.1 MCE family protein [Candidatus Competibacter sp.]MDG4605120.1 MlaD family protein [Candidatus Contendobacter sp.]HRD49848.1 MlaD family protein [Candidatus Contendobacter sp.]
MQSKVNYTLVGLFVIVLFAALTGAVFWLTLGGDNKTFDRYRVYFRESVAGLNPKATVRYRGVQVGQVESIRLDSGNPDQVDVVLDIERGTPIRRDTIATLSTRGLTGVASVELSGGGQSLPLEKAADQDLPVIQAGPSLVARLDDAFNNILTNVNNLSNRLERLLGDENQIAITRILQHLSTITGAVADRADSLRQTLVNLEAFTGMLAGRAEPLGKALDRLAAGLEKSGDLSAQVQATLSDVRAGAQAVRRTADTFNRTSQELSDLAKDGQRELQRLGQTTLPELNALLAQVGDLAAVLQRLAELLEQNPRALLLGKPSGRPGPGEE